jgi:hypothetical protein
MMAEDPCAVGYKSQRNHLRSSLAKTLFCSKKEHVGPYGTSERGYSRIWSKSLGSEDGNIFFWSYTKHQHLGANLVTNFTNWALNGICTFFSEYRQKNT